MIHAHRVPLTTNSIGSTWLNKHISLENEHFLLMLNSSLTRSTVYNEYIPSVKKFYKVDGQIKMLCPSILKFRKYLYISFVHVYAEYKTLWEKLFEVVWYLNNFMHISKVIMCAAHSQNFKLLRWKRKKPQMSWTLSKQQQNKHANFGISKWIKTNFRLYLPAISHRPRTALGLTATRSIQFWIYLQSST